LNSTTLYNTKQNKYVKLDKTMHVNIKHTYTNRGRELYLWAEEDPSKRERERERESFEARGRERECGSCLGF
jgi:hypothetical protein